MTSTATPSEQSGRIRAIVGEHIEPITRFDAGDLHEIEAEKAFAVPLTLTLDQAVSFAKDVRSGAGALPGGIATVADRASLETELDARLSRAQQEAPQAAQAWAEASKGSYRRVMPAAAAFLTPPGVAGYQYRCTTCSGSKQVECRACSGKGKTACTRCQTSGRVACPACDGNKSKPCTAYPCNGRGRWTEVETQSVWSSAEDRYINVTVHVDHTCPVCFSTGRVTCYQCDAGGKVSCSNCGGGGHIDCRSCNRTGKVNCSDCAATGIQHLRGSIAANIQHGERLDIETDDKTLHQLIATRLAPGELPAWGGLDQVTIQTQGPRLRSTHRLHVDVREARLTAGSERFVLHGFGPEVQVFDFCNIAGHLLEADLQQLEHALSASSRWRRQGGASLLASTAEFLRSELNMLIAEHATAQSDSPDAAAAAVEAHFGGLVSKHYVARASQALQGALARLYGAGLLEPAASLCGLAALLMALSLALGWPTYAVWPNLLGILAGAALVWLIVEWRTRRHIARQFPGEYGKRVVAQLNKQGSVQRWRKGLAIALPAALLCTVVATAMLPPVQALRQGYRDQMQSDDLLQAWLSSRAEPDLQLRHYPAHGELLKKAGEGQQQAIVVLAWELLLGANGTPKNVAEAARWLEQAKPETLQSNYWKAARAVQTLNEESMPDTLHAAARDLAEASDQGLAEAGYWLARLYLAPQSPLHDVRQGMYYLSKAADQKHAHAALLAAQKYARGEGVKRDTTLARRYAGIASQAGLPEAKAILNP